jgi:hypothetical protein
MYRAKFATGRKRTMPYAGGESPKVGDYVKNKFEQPGTVTAVHVTTEGQEPINIRWDERAVEARSIEAAEFTLLAREAGQSRNPTD